LSCAELQTKVPLSENQVGKLNRLIASDTTFYIGYPDGMHQILSPS